MVALRRKGSSGRVLRVPPPRPAAVASTNGGLLPVSQFLPKPCFWVLAGGGAHGAVQLGSLQAISESDARADAVMGTSAGALTGAVIAEDPVSAVNRLAYLWAAIDVTDIVGPSWLSLITPSSVRSVSLADSVGERASLEAVYAARDFADLILPMSVVATDIATGQPHVFDSGPLIEALMASSAIPGALPPVEIDGRWYMDGLASANLPASMAMRHGAGSIIAFDTGSSGEREITPAAQSIVPAINSLLASTQRSSSLSAAAEHIPVVYLPTPNNLAGSLSFKDSLGTAQDSYLLARDFLVDLVDQYGEGPLPRGLYARPGAVVCRSGDVLRPVKPAGDS